MCLHCKGAHTSWLLLLSPCAPALRPAPQARQPAPRCVASPITPFPILTSSPPAAHLILLLYPSLHPLLHFWPYLHFFQSHRQDNQDPDVWRPPSRDGPVRVQPRAAAPQRARASSDDRPQQLPGWAQRGQAGGGAPVPAARAPSAPRAKPGSVAANGRGGSGGAAPAGRGGAAAGSYEKPWRKGMVDKEDKSQDKAGQPKKKEYAGPDPDLAVQLERDMMDGSPNISWTDIAGLIDAKRVLEEAAVLPLIMPGGSGSRGGYEGEEGM